jgi:plasmid maintenance system antidote protein VapI
MEKIHIGRLIQKKMEEERRSATWLAEQLKCHRSNIYKIYESPAIDTALLYRISRILGYDFFKRCSEELTSASKQKE